jgi:hypothetical protein
VLVTAVGNIAFSCGGDIMAFYQIQKTEAGRKIYDKSFGDILLLS